MASHYALLALALAAAATTLRRSALPPAPGETLGLLTQALGILFLGTTSACLLLERDDDADRQQTDPRTEHALLLLSACGGLLALSADHLATVTVGLLLLSSAEDSRAGAPGRAAPRGVTSLSGGALFFGCALIYASAGTMQMASLSDGLWRYGGTPPPLLYAGLALFVGGIAISTDLGRGSIIASQGSGIRLPLLGLCLLLRFGLSSVAMLADQWLWVCGVASIALACTGWLGSLIVRSWTERLSRLTLLQRGLLIWALPLAVQPQGLPAILLGLLTYVLAHLILHCVSQRSFETPRSGLNAWDTRAATTISLLALAGIPGTLGFGLRVHALLTSERAMLGGYTLVGLALCALALLSYLPLVVDLLRSRGHQTGWAALPLNRRLVLVLATLLLTVGGLYSRPLVRWAIWITGG